MGCFVRNWEKLHSGKFSIMFCICSFSNLVHTNMYRIMKAQTLGDTSHMDFMRGQRILEINPNHPIVQDLKVGVLMNSLWTWGSHDVFSGLGGMICLTLNLSTLQHTSKSNPQSAQSKQMLDLLYETALLSSGYTVSWILILLCQCIFSLFNININLGQYCWSLISVWWHAWNLNLSTPGNPVYSDSIIYLMCMDRIVLSFWDLRS